MGTSAWRSFKAGTGVVAGSRAVVGVTERVNGEDDENLEGDALMPFKWGRTQPQGLGL